MVALANAWVFPVLALLSLVTSIGAVIAQSLLISVSAAVLSFICWGVTALVYLYENHAFPGPAYLFGLFAIIMVLYAIFAGIKLLDPQEVARLEDDLN